jgi:hypothetical protein
MPGRPGAPPSRPAGGRGGRSPAASAPGRGAGRRPMPCVEENGLFPGRGDPGRPVGRAGGRGVPARAAGSDGAFRAAGASGCAGGWVGGASVDGAWVDGASVDGASVDGAWVDGAWGPGRGPGTGACRAAAESGAGTGAAAGAADGAAAAAGASATGAGSATSGCAAAGADAVGSAAGEGAGWAAAFFAGAAFFAAPLPAPADLSSSPYCFLNFASTGSSTVDDADLTNSPISLSFSRTTLLSTPSSLASSWTRVLATLLLLARVPAGEGEDRTASWCARSSVSTHRVLMSCCSRFSRSDGQCWYCWMVPGGAGILRRCGRTPRLPWWPTPVRCAAPGGRPGDVLRAPGTPGSGAGAHRVRAPGPPDRGRPHGRLPGRRRRPAAARASRPAPGSRCRCGHCSGVVPHDQKTCADPASPPR